MENLPASEINHAKHVFYLLPTTECRVFQMTDECNRLFAEGGWLRDEDAVVKAICSTRAAGRPSRPATRLNRAYAVMAMQNALNISNKVRNVDGDLVPSWHRVKF